MIGHAPGVQPVRSPPGGGFHIKAGVVRLGRPGRGGARPCGSPTEPLLRTVRAGTILRAAVPRSHPLRSLIRSEGLLRECVCVFVAIVAAYLLLRGSALFLVGAFNDDGVYVMLGKSLASGTGYHLTYLIGAPVAVKYPPGLPALLAIPWALGGTLSAVRATVAILNPLACGLAAALIWWIGRRDLALSRFPLAVAAIGPLLLDDAIQYYSIPLAEPYFLLGWAAAAAIAASITRSRGALALGLVIAAATLFRSAGLVLIPACLAALALRRLPWRVVAIGATGAIAPLIVWGVVHGRLIAEGPLSSSPDEVSYWSLIPFGSARLPVYLLHVLWNNGRVYFLELSGTLAGPVVVGHLLVLGWIVGVGVGAARSWRRAPALALTAAASFAVVMVWPFAQDRLLLPVIPFMGLLAAVAIDELAKRLPARLRFAAPLGLALALLIVGFRQIELRRTAAASFVEGRIPAPRDASGFYVLALNSRYIATLSEWTRTHTTPKDRLLVDSPSGVYLYTGRLTAAASPAEADYAPSVFNHPGRYLTERILQDSVTIVAVGGRGILLQDIATISRNCPGVLLRQVPRAEVYRVVRDEACLRSIALR